MARVTSEDVGTIWQKDDGSVWRLISYCEHPTATWQRIDEKPPNSIIASAFWHPTRISGAVGSAITDGLTKLVPEP